MQSPNRKRPSSEQGFALVTALMACAILFALAMLVLNLSTGDLKVSALNVGDKKAAIAAETGIQQVLTIFDPENLPSAANVPVDAVNAPGSVYSFSTPIHLPNDSGPCPVGYDCSIWTQKRYKATITGQNTRYSTKVEVDVGIGYVTGGGGYR
jgi:Tfp pilus assembly protein PilX